MSTQIKYAYKRHNTWVYRRTYPQHLQPLLGSSLKQSLKTADAKTAKARVAELNQTYQSIITEAEDDVQTLTKLVPKTQSQCLFADPRPGIERPRYHHARFWVIGILKTSNRVPHLSVRTFASRELQGHQVCHRALGIASGNQPNWRHHASTGQGGAVSDSAVSQCAEVC